MDSGANMAVAYSPDSGIGRRLVAPAPSREQSSLERAKLYLGWLGPAHRVAAAELLTVGVRLAQEWVGLRHLTTSTEWYQDLR